MKIVKLIIPSVISLIAIGMGCGYSKPAMSAAAMPAISQLSPSSVAAGGAQFQMEVDGTNFASNAVVNFNGTVETTTFVSASKLETMIPAAAIMNSGSVPVTVTNPGTSGIYGTAPTTSMVRDFSIN
jgi:hypothetical protein